MEARGTGHEVTDVTRFGERWVGTCSCGWQTQPALLESSAGSRAAMHGAERRSAVWLNEALALQADARRCTRESERQRDVAVQQRSHIGEQRRRVNERMGAVRASASVVLGPSLPGEDSQLRHAARRIDLARRLAGMTVSDLWLVSFSLGGDLSVHEVQETMAGMRTPTALEHDVLALAVNERFFSEGLGRPLDYWEQPAF